MSLFLHISFSLPSTNPMYHMYLYHMYCNCMLFIGVTSTVFSLRICTYTYKITQQLGSSTLLVHHLCNPNTRLWFDMLILQFKKGKIGSWPAGNWASLRCTCLQLSEDMFVAEVRLYQTVWNTQTCADCQNQSSNIDLDNDV